MNDVLLDWKVKYDPLGLLSRRLDSYAHLHNEAVRYNEDTFQLEHCERKLLLDLGWYDDVFGLALVDPERGWEDPIIEEDFGSLDDAMVRFWDLVAELL